MTDIPLLRETGSGLQSLPVDGLFFRVTVISLDQALARSRWVPALAAAIAAALFARAYAGLPPSPAPENISSPPLQWLRPVRIASEDWGAFQRRQAGTPTSSGPLAKRFRLAGTFFVFSEAVAGQESARRAVLDDLQTSEQHLVAEGQTVAGIQVASIFPDRIVLRGEGREEELWLTFAGAAGARPAARPAAAAGQPEPAALETSRFGKRVGESRWVFTRDALMEYYQELLDDPERLASVYLSLKPDYQGGKIAGYVLDMEGEEDFFKAVGLQNGDVIRMVNSMRMTSQSRAEFFIGEFVKNRLSAVVIDFERAQKPGKFIYLVR